MPNNFQFPGINLTFTPLGNFRYRWEIGPKKSPKELNNTTPINSNATFQTGENTTINLKIDTNRKDVETFTKTFTDQAENLTSEFKNVNRTLEQHKKGIAKTFEQQKEGIAKTVGGAVVARDIAKATYDQTVGSTAQLRKLNNTVNTGLKEIKKAMVKDSSNPAILEEIMKLAQVIQQNSNPDSSKFASLSSIFHSYSNQSQKQVASIGQNFHTGPSAFAPYQSQRQPLSSLFLVPGLLLFLLWLLKEVAFLKQEQSNEAHSESFHQNILAPYDPFLGTFGDPLDDFETFSNTYWKYLENIYLEEKKIHELLEENQKNPEVIEFFQEKGPKFFSSIDSILVNHENFENLKHKYKKSDETGSQSFKEFLKKGKNVREKEGEDCLWSLQVCLYELKQFAKDFQNKLRKAP